MAAEPGSFAAARFLAVENTVRDLGLVVADMGNSVPLLNDAQGTLSESVKTRIDEMSGSILGIGQTMDAHTQLLQSHEETFRTFKAGCKTLAGNVETVEQQSAENARGMHC